MLPVARPNDGAARNGLHERKRDVLIGASACGAPQGTVVLMLGAMLDLESLQDAKLACRLDVTGHGPSRWEIRCQKGPGLSVVLLLAKLGQRSFNNAGASDRHGARRGRSIFADTGSDVEWSAKSGRLPS